MKINSILCPICNKEVDSVCHLFLGCDLTHDLLHLLCRWWNLSTSCFIYFIDWINWFDSLRISKVCKLFLEAVFYTLWWSIWCFRNSLVFGKVKPKKCLLFIRWSPKVFFGLRVGVVKLVSVGLSGYGILSCLFLICNGLFGLASW